MLNVRYSTKFKKDFKACIKRNYKMALLQQAIDILRIPDTLPVKNKDQNELLLYRTGTHSDLFGL